MRRSPSSDAGFTLVELLVVLAIVGVLASLAMAGYRQARMRGGEASAISTLAAINQAQFLYMQTCGNGRYAPTLVALGTPAAGFEEGFLSPDLTVSDPLQKSGYVFRLSGTASTEGEPTCTNLVPLDSYKLTADPLLPGRSGTLSFGTNTERVVYSDSHTFAEDMPEVGAPGHGAEIK